MPPYSALPNSAPPVFLLVAGLFISLTSGLAFEAGLKQVAAQLSIQLSTQPEPTPQDIPASTGDRPELLMPFLGIALGACLFLGAGLGLFGFPLRLTLIVASLLTLLAGLLIWTQLQKLLARISQGDGRALDWDWLE